ncbi:hypothetical protein Syun_016270 [Stephania yunnanensis]|uniref:Protein kinase domain-containing protein n=1 Tax=Stephania yunnanensis TaxID=152371 RepID=A0AAP0J6W2_9MAGN
MCKSKTKTAASDPAKSTSRTTNRPARTTKSSSLSSSTASRIPNKSVSSSSDPSTSYGSYYNFNTNSTFKDNSTTSTSSKTSLTSLRASLPEKTHIYDFSEIQQSTNNFLANRISSSSSAWRCAIRGKDAVVFQRRFRRPIDAAEVGELLSVICRSHHRTLVKLLGASISGDHIFLVYEHVSGASLSHCLRNPKNPNFTVLSDWMSRMQVAIDLAQGLEYIHHYTGLDLDLVHNHIESSSVIVTEPSFNAKICHFGTSELCGEITASSKTHQKEDLVEKNSKIASIYSRRDLKVEGTIAYMSPELRSEGIATQKSDVYAFGVVVLELLSGEEAMRVEFDGERGEFVRVSVIESAREAVDDESGDLGRVRRWMDGRLRDSYPVEVAEKMMRMCLDCCHVDPDQRPDMRRAAGKFSKFYLESRTWCEKRSVPTDFSISLAPR